MQRNVLLKKFNIKSRNKLRAILSNPEGNTIRELAKFSANLSQAQTIALDGILSSSALTKAVKALQPFPKNPPFSDVYQLRHEQDLCDVLEYIDSCVRKYKQRLKHLVNSFRMIDQFYAEGKIDEAVEKINDTLDDSGWSHAILRRIILIRENIGADCINEKIESLVLQAGVKNGIVSSLIHSYSRDQNVLMNKRAILGLSDRGFVNRYTRALCKICVQPTASSKEELANTLKEIIKCSLIDTIILAKFNSHLFNMDNYSHLCELTKSFGDDELFEEITKTYNDGTNSGEYAFYKQSSAWLEYDAVKKYRILIDSYYDSSREEEIILSDEHEKILQGWVGETTLHELVGNTQFTRHRYKNLAELEASGTVTRSALFNYWLYRSNGAVTFERESLLTLMGLTRDLARTIPIKAVRMAAKIALDESVKLILLLLLAKRSKNEYDSFSLRKAIEKISSNHHNGSLVELVKFYAETHPDIAEYIYDIATEDFLAKLTKLAPNRSDIPEIRASLHEWMADFKQDEYFRKRARAVRIDHQINRIRNEIDDHRIYVDPMKFTSWLEDEMMIELNAALSSSGTEIKGISVGCDETMLSMVINQSYTAFCSNAVFGISSYIGRRIRHGTFHGHMYSSVVNVLENNDKFTQLFANVHFKHKWDIWKDRYNHQVEEIIAKYLHVKSKSKPYGLLTPEDNTQAKQDVILSAVSNIINHYSETNSTADICPIVIDYCWRLAELDLVAVSRYLKAQQTTLKNLQFINAELLPAANEVNVRVAALFGRELELVIDRKFATLLGWFKRPSIVAPKASVSLLFAATVAEVKDTIPDFEPQLADTSKEEIELVGSFYHLIYDSLAIVVGNAAKHSDRNRPLKRNFEIVTGKEKRLIIEVSSSIKQNDDPSEVAKQIETCKCSSFQDANLYDTRSGIAKLQLLASNRKEFKLEQYEVIGREVQVRLSYALEH